MPRSSRTHTIHTPTFTPFTGRGVPSGRRGMSTDIRAALRRYGPGIMNGLAASYGGIRTAPVSRTSTIRSESSGIRTGKVMNEGTGGQYSSFNGKTGKSYLPSHVENALAPKVTVGAFASQIKSSVGTQQVAVPLTLFYPNIAQNFVADKISRVIYEKATGDITLNNIFLSNAYVIIYDCYARKDLSLTTISTPLNGWAQGDTDQSASVNYASLGATPFQSELFNQYFKVAQVTNVVLCAGGTHVHKVRLNPKKIVSNSYATYTPYGFKDLTYFCMVEVHGSPANDTTTQTQVSVGIGGLNVIADYEQTYKLLEAKKPEIIQGPQLLTAFTVGEQVLNLGGSTIVPQAEG